MVRELDCGELNGYLQQERGHFSEEPSSMHVIDPFQFPSVFRGFGKLGANSFSDHR